MRQLKEISSNSRYIIYNFEHTPHNKNVTHSVCVKNMIHMLQVLRFPSHSQEYFLQPIDHQGFPFKIR